VSCVAIVGLGNPGSQYKTTRHNLGFWLVEKLANLHNASFQEKSKYCAQVAMISNLEKSFMIVKPLTFMNESGKYLKNLLSKNNCDSTQTILVHDELTLPIGHMKISKGNGDGGHNGVRSVFSGIGDNLVRLRLGIGQKRHPEMELSDHVLSRFSSDESQVLEQRAVSFLKALQSLMFEGTEKAMCLYNQSTPKTI